LSISIDLNLRREFKAAAERTTDDGRSGPEGAVCVCVCVRLVDARDEATCQPRQASTDLLLPWQQLLTTSL
jgi:hypothetical protein